MWTFKKKKKEEYVKTFSATGSKVKITTKSGSKYILSTDQNMLELLDNINNTVAFVYDINGKAVKASEIEAVEYLVVGGQEVDKPDEII